MSETVIHPIRRARQRRQLSLDVVAQRVGVTKATVSKWELGNAFPSPSTAFRLSRMLNLPLEQIYASARAAA